VGFVLVFQTAAADDCRPMEASLPGPFQGVAQFLLGKRLKWEFGRRNNFRVEESKLGAKKDHGVPEDFFMFLNWANSTFRDVTALPMHEVMKKTVEMMRLLVFRKSALMGTITTYLPSTKWRVIDLKKLDMMHVCVKLSYVVYEDEWRIQRFLSSRGYRLIKWNAGANVNLPAFFIAEDPRDHTLLVSIRGTQHVNDVFTSFQTNVTSLQLYRPKQKATVHSGFLHSAKMIFETHIVPLMKVYSNREIILTGHSLGGAVATLLTLLLERSTPNPLPFKSIKAITFGAPPSCAGNISMPSLSSISMEGDLVPRLSLQNAYLIRDFYLNEDVGPDHFNQHPAKDSLLVPGNIFWVYSTIANLPGSKKESESHIRAVDKFEHNKLIFGLQIFEQHTLSVYKRNIGKLRDRYYKEQFPAKAENAGANGDAKEEDSHFIRKIRSRQTSPERDEEGNGRLRIKMNILGSEYRMW